MNPDEIQLEETTADASAISDFLFSDSNFVSTEDMSKFVNADPAKKFPVLREKKKNTKSIKSIVDMMHLYHHRRKQKPHKFKFLRKSIQAKQIQFSNKEETTPVTLQSEENSEESQFLSTMNSLIELFHQNKPITEEDEQQPQQHMDFLEREKQIVNEKQEIEKESVQNQILHYCDNIIFETQVLLQVFEKSSVTLPQEKSFLSSRLSIFLKEALQFASSNPIASMESIKSAWTYIKLNSELTDPLFNFAKNAREKKNVSRIAKFVDEVASEKPKEAETNPILVNYNQLYESLCSTKYDLQN